MKELLDKLFGTIYTRHKDGGEEISHTDMMANFRAALAAVQESEEVDVNDVTDSGENALFAAITKGEFEMARELIEAGVKLDILTNSHSTILHILGWVPAEDIAKPEFIAFINETIFPAIDSNVLNRGGQSALDFARERNNEALIKLLENHNVVETRAEDVGLASAAGGEAVPTELTEALGAMAVVDEA